MDFMEHRERLGAELKDMVMDYSLEGLILRTFSLNHYQH